MKKWMYLIALVAVIGIFLLIDIYSQKNALEKQLQNQYTQQMALASEEMTTLHEALYQSTILKDEKALQEQLLQVHTSSGSIKQAIAAIPNSPHESNDWMQYMTKLQTLAANTIQNGSYTEWHEKSTRLATNIAAIEEEWAVLSTNFFQHTSTLKNFTTSNPAISQLSTHMKTFSEKSFPITASESDYEKKKKLEHVALPPITKKEAEQKLYELFPHLKGANITISLNEKDAPYEFYHIQFIRGSRIGYVDLLKSGGLLLSMLIDRPIREQQISQQDARQYVEQFLQQKQMADTQFVEVRENHEAWHFVYARVEDGVLIYPDTLQIKVAKDSPEIIGVSALEYVQKERFTLKTAKKIDWSEILNSNASVQQSRLVLIEGKNYEPVVCYEAFVTSNIDHSHTYKVVVNAENHIIEKIELIN